MVTTHYHRWSGISNTWPRTRRRPAQREARSQRGSALLCALLVTTLLSTLGAALVVLVTTETLVDAHYRASQQALYAAEAGAERTIGEIRALGSWQTIPTPGSAATSGRSERRNDRPSSRRMVRLSTSRASRHAGKRRATASTRQIRIVRNGGSSRTRRSIESPPGMAAPRLHTSWCGSLTTWTISTAIRLATRTTSCSYAHRPSAFEGRAARLRSRCIVRAPSTEREQVARCGAT